MIFLDMDGVIADFVKSACEMHGKPVTDADCWDFYEKWGITEDEFWEPINNAGREWWANLEPYPWFGELVKAVEAAEPGFMICTKPSREASCLAGKLDWIHKHFGERFRRYIFTPHKEHLAKESTMLIDDSDENCRKFRQAGGAAVTFAQPWNVCRVDTPGDLSDTIQLLEVYRDNRRAT